MRRWAAVTGAVVALALIDGKIDRNEKKMLEAAALHLGLSAQLPALLKG